MISVYRNRGPFIFFTWWGVSWISLVFLIFAFSMQRSDKNLLILALLLGSLTFFAILLTHENASGLRKIQTQWTTNFENGVCSICIQLINPKSTPIHRLRAVLQLNNLSQVLKLSKVIPRIEAHPSEQFVSIPLPWGHPRSETAIPHQITLESRFPFGLLRVWHVWRISNLEEWPLAPEPIKVPAWAKDRLMVEQGPDQPEIILQPLTNQSPLRIDWKASIRTGSLLVKDFQNGDLSILQSSKNSRTIRWIPASDPLLSKWQQDDLRENQVRYVYTLAIDSLRSGSRTRFVDSQSYQLLLDFSPSQKSHFLQLLIPLLWRLHAESSSESSLKSVEVI